MSGCGRRGGGLVAGFVGLVFVVLGVGLGFFGSRAATAAADRAEQLPLLTAQSVERGAVDQEAIVEGRISARNPARFREFVAYIREEYHGTDDDGDPDWREDERVTPPLLLELDDGPVQIENSSYRMENPPSRWQDSGGLSWNGLTGEGTKRYLGFTAGAQIVTIGRIVEGREGLALEAEFITAGTRADYMANQRSAAGMFPIVGMIFGGIGALIALGGVWSAIRG
jgi:hypothetical protein